LPFWKEINLFFFLLDMGVCRIGELLECSRKVEGWLNLFVKRGNKMSGKLSPGHQTRLSNQFCITLIR
jgi:hypothetical protein